MSSYARIASSWKYQDSSAQLWPILIIFEIEDVLYSPTVIFHEGPKPPELLPDHRIIACRGIGPVNSAIV